MLADFPLSPGSAIPSLIRLGVVQRITRTPQRRRGESAQAIHELVDKNSFLIGEPAAAMLVPSTFTGWVHEMISTMPGPHRDHPVKSVPTHESILDVI